MTERPFVANESRWLGLDRLYLISICDGAIAGACVGGQIWAAPSDYNDPWVLVDRQRAERYETIDPSTQAFLDADPVNFRYLVSELSEVRVAKGHSWWMGPIANSCSLYVTPRTGRRRRFIVLGKGRLESVHSALRSINAPLTPLAA